MATKTITLNTETIQTILTALTAAYGAACDAVPRHKGYVTNSNSRGYIVKLGKAIDEFKAESIDEYCDEKKEVTTYCHICHKPVQLIILFNKHSETTILIGHTTYSTLINTFKHSTITTYYCEEHGKKFPEDKPIISIVVEKEQEEFVPPPGEFSGCRCPNCPEKQTPRRKCACCEDRRISDKYPDEKSAL